MIATTSDVDVRDELEIYVPVVYNVTTETVTTVGVITGGKATEQLGVPEDLQ